MAHQSRTIKAADLRVFYFCSDLGLVMYRVGSHKELLEQDNHVSNKHHHFI
jgi:hypothetical protein